MPPSAPLRRTIESHTGPRALSATTRAALTGLGYDIVPGSRTAAQEWKPSLRLVDERRLDEIPTASQDPATPIVSLTGARPLRREDPRIVGRVRRPAPLTDLYRLIQEALEEHPRKVPRVPTQMAARCVRADRRWVGAILSISSGGCLLQSREPVEPDSRFNVQFALPEYGLVDLRGRAIHRRGDFAGVAFPTVPEQARTAIESFVTERLASL